MQLRELSKKKDNWAILSHQAIILNDFQLPSHKIYDVNYASLPEEQTYGAQTSQYKHVKT